jgi:chromosome segregation ATPase
MFEELIALADNPTGLIFIVLAGLLWLSWRQNNRTQGLLDHAAEANGQMQDMVLELREKIKGLHEQLDQSYDERRTERLEYEEKLRLQSVRIDDLMRRMEQLGQERADQEAELRATIAKKDEEFSAYKVKVQADFRVMQSNVSKLKSDLEAEREKYRNLQMLHERVAMESAKRAERILEDTETIREHNQQIAELTTERDALKDDVRQLVARVDLLEQRLKEFEEKQHETNESIVNIDRMELVVGDASDGAGGQSSESDGSGDIRAIGDGGGDAAGDRGDDAA